MCYIVPSKSLQLADKVTIIYEVDGEIVVLKEIKNRVLRASTQIITNSSSRAKELIKGFVKEEYGN